MCISLLIVIYITFIGLGIPDSLFGTAWPAIYTEFDVPVSWAGFVTLTVSGGTIISSLLSGKLIRRFGTGKVTAFSTIMTAAALGGFSCAGSFWMLWIMAVPLGLGAGAIDTALNSYVALHYKSSHMNFLHCFYGIGVSLSPFLMSLALFDHAAWRNGCQMVFILQMAIAILTTVTLPLWKKQGNDLKTGENTEPAGILPLLKTPKIYFTGLIFFASCAIEYTCGSWGSTFLVTAKGLTADIAAGIITFYYAGMAAGRFLSGILANKCTSWQLMTGGQGIVLAAVILLSAPLPAIFSGIALFFIGLGNGPAFPNMLQLTPVNFGRNASQSAMGVQMAVSYLGIMIAPAVFGLTAQYIGTVFFPYYLMMMYVMMVIGIIGIRTVSGISHKTKAGN